MTDPAQRLSFAAWFSPEEGLFGLRAPNLPEGEYLVWAEDAPLARVEAANLSQGVVLSPICRLEEPCSVRVQRISGGLDLQGPVWIRKETGDPRRIFWRKARRRALRRAVLLARDSRPEPAFLRRVLAEVQGRSGKGYFDGFGLAVLAEGGGEEALDPESGFDLQARLEIGGLKQAGRTQLLEAQFAEEPDLVCLPLDSFTAREALRLEKTPVLLGSWLPETLGPGRLGLRLLPKPVQEASFEREGGWLTLTTPRAPDLAATTERLLRLWFGTAPPEASSARRRADLAGGLLESGEACAILLTPGGGKLDELRALKDARFFSLEMIPREDPRLGAAPEPFAWADLAGRLLVYPGEDQILDDLFAAECRRRGLAYRSLFTRFAPG